MPLQALQIRHSNSVNSLNRADKSKSKISFDILGIIASCLCIVHCSAMPLLISIMPMLGWHYLEADWTHKALAFFVVCFAVLAVVPGYWKHKRRPVLLGLLSGLSFVLFATFLSDRLLGPNSELPLITVGNLIIVSTHWFNRLYCSCSHD
jgi:hypothetical protein